MNRFVLMFILVLGACFPAFADEHGSHTDTTWTCSMHPQIQLPEAGQCPICFMDLIELVRPKSGEAPQSLRQIGFDERARRLAQVEVTTVVRADQVVQTRLVGKVEYDETYMGRITAWVAGRIDRLDVDYTGAVVKKGQVMALIYSPELLTAQVELIQAGTSYEQAMASSTDLLVKSSKSTLEASKEKLRLLGLSTDKIADILQRKTVDDHVNITAPMGGIVIRKDVVEGMYVKTGTSLFTIADLRHLWVVLEAYEADLARVKLGQDVEFNVEAFPGQGFHGKVVYIDPLVDAKSRTVRVRLNVDNTDGRLIPGMFVQALVQRAVGQERSSLMIPATAPLLTGKRALVYVELKEGVYEGREVVLGSRNGDFYEVRFGLKEGDRVVSRGAFKIDSAIQIQARPSMMNVYAGSLAKNPPADLFLSRLQFLQDQFMLLSERVHREDIKGAKASVLKMRALLAELPEDGLQGGSKLAWHEMRMTLAADLFLLAEVRDKQELSHVYAEMAEHFSLITSHFRLVVSSGKHGSPELRKAFGLFVSQYLELQDALTKDDEAGAKKRILGMQKMLPDLIAVMGSKKISSFRDDFREQLATLAQAPDLHEIREGFYPLSVSVTKVLTFVEVPVATPLYLHFCPMAFDNKGATWVDGRKEINNPYFGTMMLRCGELRKQLQE